VSTWLQDIRWSDKLLKVKPVSMVDIGDIESELVRDVLSFHGDEKIIASWSDLLVKK